MKSLVECMVDPEIFGRTFAAASFAAWRTVAKILDGLPLEPDELGVYRSITGRTQAPCEPFSEGYLANPAVRAARSSARPWACMRRSRTTAIGSAPARSPPLR